MFRSVGAGILCATMLCAVIISGAVGQPPRGSSDAAKGPERPRQPGGVLTDSLGEYLTIEGILDEGDGKVAVLPNTLLVDTVDGKKLDIPIDVSIRNTHPLPAKVRCVLKGYELGAMIGTPPAVRKAAKEQGRKYVESPSQWRWSSYFFVLIVAQPNGVELVNPKW